MTEMTNLMNMIDAGGRGILFLAFSAAAIGMMTTAL